jgi:hypothetical protein
MLDVVLMVFVLEVPVHPPGKVQVYETAPATLVIEYVFELPEQIVLFPVINPGVPGIEFTLTRKIEGVDEPQVLFAVTVILPPVIPATAVIELVVDVPDQPPGNVQV